MARLRRLDIILGVIVATVANSSFGWDTCDLKITFPEKTELQCKEGATETFEIEAEIVSTGTLSEESNCRWSNRYDELIKLPRAGNICKARLTVDKAEAYFITVTYSDEYTTKKCTATKKLDVDPVCCVVL